MAATTTGVTGTGQMESAVDVTDAGIEFAASGRSASTVRALSAVNLTVRRGSFTSVVGPSGCGKSTLLRILAGLIPPTEGEVRVLGEKVSAPRDGIGFVFQQATLLPWRNVRDNVLLPAEVQAKNKRAYRERADELIELVGLTEFAESLPHQLSGGMQQRVGICRALLMAPPLLLMDEPFGALDAMTRDHLNVALVDIWRRTGTTIIFVTHSIPEAVFLSDEIAVMTPRPGTVAEVVPVTLDRDRGLDALHHPDAGQIISHIRGYFEPQRRAKDAEKGAVGREF